MTSQPEEAGLQIDRPRGDGLPIDRAYTRGLSGRRRWPEEAGKLVDSQFSSPSINRFGCFHWMYAVAGAI